MRALLRLYLDQPSPAEGGRGETSLLFRIVLGDKNARTSFSRTGIRSRKTFLYRKSLFSPSSLFIVFSIKYIFLFPYASLRNTRAIKTSRREGRAKKRPLFLASFFSPLRLALVIKQHARTHARNTRRKRTEYTGERRTRLASVNRGALDRRPLRESGIAATKRERTRPLVFIRVPHWPPRTTVSLFRGASPTPGYDERVHERIRTRSGRSRFSFRDQKPVHDHGRSFIGFFDPSRKAQLLFF